MADKDGLGDRMKDYERRETERRFLPYLPIYARIDGKGFSKFTKGMERPYDTRMSFAMIQATMYLVEQTQAVVGYTQSDEISLVWITREPGEQMFFDGKVQKLTSVIAAMATAAFTRDAVRLWPEKVMKTPPVFDARVFQLPTLGEAANAILWRENDATKNAISMAARSFFSHKELQNKSGSEMQEMMWSRAGKNFNDYPDFFKRGTFVQRRKREVMLTELELARIPEKNRPTGPVERWKVEAVPMPSFRKVTNRKEVIFDGADPVCDDMIHRTL